MVSFSAAELEALAPVEKDYTFSEAEQAVLNPREDVSAADWAVANRYFSPQASPSHPGPYQHLAPWMPWLINAMASRTVDWMAILKAAQLAVSECVRTAQGYAMQNDPLPVLWVMTTEKFAKRAMEKVRFMVNDTPCLAALKSPAARDDTVYGIALSNGAETACAWAGSPQAMATDPFGWVVLDEVAKHKVEGADGEANSIGLGYHRTKAFGRRRKMIALSSPKHENDLICQAFEETLAKFYFFVPCPHCRQHQRLEPERISFPGGSVADPPTEPRVRLELADRIDREQCAFYACAHCEAGFDPRQAMWDPEATWGREHEDGTVELDAPLERRMAVQISELYHWKTTIHELAATFLRALTPKQLQNVWNGSFGLPFRSQKGAIPAALFRQRAIYPQGVVPSWATVILTTADTQARGWWYMTRAWGPGLRSRLLDWGWAESEEELRELGLLQEFTLEQLASLPEGSMVASARALKLGVDMGGGMESPDGSRTEQVKRWARQTPGVVLLKGEGGKNAVDAKPVRWTEVSAGRKKKKRKRMQEVAMLNATYWKDNLAQLIRAEEPVLWEECHQDEDALKLYSKQMASEQQVGVDKGDGIRWEWRKRSHHHPNHLWNCAHMQVAMAMEIVNVDRIQTPVWDRRDLPAGYARKQR